MAYTLWIIKLAARKGQKLTDEYMLRLQVSPTIQGLQYFDSRKNRMKLRNKSLASKATEETLPDEISDVRKGNKQEVWEKLQIMMDDTNLFECAVSRSEKRKKTVEPIHTQQFNFNNVLKRFQSRNRRDTMPSNKTRIIVDCGVNQIKPSTKKDVKQEPTLNCIDSIRTKSMNLTQRPTIAQVSYASYQLNNTSRRHVKEVPTKRCISQEKTQAGTPRVDRFQLKPWETTQDPDDNLWLL